MVKKETEEMPIGFKKEIILDLKEKLRPYICPFDDILNEIGKGESIFDIGCGQGGLLLLCANNLHPTKIAGIEIRKELVHRAQKNLGDVKIPSFISIYDGNNIPDEVSKYSVITMIDVLHHIPQNRQLSFVSQLIMKMNKGSKLVVKDIDASDFCVYFNKLHDLIISQEHSHETNWKDFEKYLSKKGMKIESSFKKRVFVYPHFFVTSRKV